MDGRTPSTSGTDGSRAAASSPGMWACLLRCVLRSELVHQRWLADLQVWRGWFLGDNEGEDGDVRGRLARAESVAVLNLHARRRGAAVADPVRQRRASLHLQVPGWFAFRLRKILSPSTCSIQRRTSVVAAGFWSLGFLLPGTLSGGHRRGAREKNPHAERDNRECRSMERSGRLVLQLRPLVDSQGSSSRVQLLPHLRACLLRFGRS